MFTIGVVMVTMSSSAGDVPVLFGVSLCANVKIAPSRTGHAVGVEAEIEIDARQAGQPGSLR
jgi:hypothetical protein